MRQPLAVREIALAGFAVLAAAIALAVIAQTRHRNTHVPKPFGSFTALAGASGPEAVGHRTLCGVVLNADTIGVANPTLPCGTRIFVTFHHKTVLVQVIAHGLQRGRQFELTEALARQVGLSGVQPVRWSYARLS
ncbi:MAG TPA: hypothetical protein VFB25_07180 [Gaiellaceae bacterium]|nr:hypothetical protein [Gaiellaceae bacterium]